MLTILNMNSQPITKSTTVEMRQSLGYYHGNGTVCYGLSYNPHCSVIMIRTLQPAVESYLHNKDFYSTLLDLGIIPYQEEMSLNKLAFYINSYILRNFIRINHTLILQAKSIISKYSHKDLIGIHVRMSDGSSDFTESAQFVYSTDIARFYKCKYIPRTSETVLFVASDSTVAKKRIEEESNYTVIYQDTRSSHTVNEINNGKAADGIWKVLVDVVALSKCSMIIGTLGSSLSYFAAALHGSFPYYVTRNHDCFYPITLTTLHPKYMIQNNVTYQFPL